MDGYYYIGILIGALIAALFILLSGRKPKYRYDRTHARIWRDLDGKVHIVETKKPDWDDVR